MIKFLHKASLSSELKEQEKHSKSTWVYVENPNDEEVKFLIDKFGLDPGHIEDALDEDEMPRLEREGKLTYFFSRFPYTDTELQVTTAPLLIVVGKDLFVTISPQKIPKFDKYIEGKGEFATTDYSRLALTLTNDVVNQYELYLNQVGRQIKAIRSRLRVEQIRNQDFISFVVVEDELNEFMSAMTPMSAILQRILLGKHIAIKDDATDLVEDLILNNQQSIEACRSSIKSIVNIREAYSTIMANNLNQVIRILTVLTVLISVPTFIASVYGMNIDLPFQDHPLAFVGVSIFSLVMSLVLLAIFRLRKWL